MTDFMLISKGILDTLKNLTKSKTKGKSKEKKVESKPLISIDQPNNHKEDRYFSIDKESLEKKLR